MDQESINVFRKYTNSFNNDSTNTILEASNRMMRINSRQKMNSTKNLMKKLHSEFGLSIYISKVLSSTTNNLDNIDDEEIRNILHNCLENGNWTVLREIIQKQGAYDRFFPVTMYGHMSYEFSVYGTQKTVPLAQVSVYRTQKIVCPILAKY